MFLIRLKDAFEAFLKEDPIKVFKKNAEIVEEHKIEEGKVDEEESEVVDCKK